jgi:hypothetical protein
MFRCILFISAAMLVAVNLLAQNPPPGAAGTSSTYVRPITVDFSPDKTCHYFEMRTYYAAPGKLGALQARFRDFTNKLMVKHGMEIIGFWVAVSKDAGPPNTLVCILGYPSREARDRDWHEFSADLEWAAVKAESEKNGRLIEKVDTLFMTTATCAPTNSVTTIVASTNSPPRAAPQSP